MNRTITSIFTVSPSSPLMNVSTNTFVASTWSIHRFFHNLCANNSLQPRQTTCVLTYVNYPGLSACVLLQLLCHTYSRLKAFIFEVLTKKETSSYFALNHFYFANCISNVMLNISLILLPFTSLIIILFSFSGLGRWKWEILASY